MTLANHQRLTWIAAIGLFYAGFGHAQTGTVVVQVLDVVRNKPVVGSIFMNPGRLAVGKTTEQGEYEFAHKCELGQTFRAEPEDRGTYYNSSEQVCAKRVVLPVYQRPRYATAPADFGYFDEVPSTRWSPKYYVALFGGVDEKTEDVLGTSGSARCKTTFTKTLNAGYVSEFKDDWQKLKTLDTRAIARTPPSDSTYLFQSDCRTARAQIVELKEKASEEWQSSVRQYYLTNRSEIKEAGMAAAREDADLARRTAEEQRRPRR